MSHDHKESTEYKKILSDLSEIGADVASAWACISNSLKGRQKSIEEVVSVYGEVCDQLILNTTNSDGLKYVAGKIGVVSLRDDEFECLCELYFQTEQQKWIVKKATSGLMRQARELTAGAISELKEKGSIYFDVLAP